MYKKNLKIFFKSLSLPLLFLSLLVIFLFVNQKLISFANKDIDFEAGKTTKQIVKTSRLEGSLIKLAADDEEAGGESSAEVISQPDQNNFQSINITEADKNIPKNYISQNSDIGFGVNLHWAFRHNSENDFKIKKIIEAGDIDLVREEFNWQAIEKERGVKNYHRYDEIVDEYQKNNTKILGLLAYSASWASTAPSEINEAREFYPPSLNDWINFVAETASRYQGKVHAWEVWNEPNDNYFFRGTDQQYFDLLKNTYLTIKSIDPDAKIISGGITWPDPNYTRNFYNAGMGGYIDGYGVHAYYCGQGIKDGNYQKLAADVINIQNIIEKNNAGQKIWLTEIGCSSYNYPENEQAQQLFYMISELKSFSFIENIFWYCLQDTDMGNEAGKFGLIDSSYHYKPAWPAWIKATAN